MVFQKRRHEKKFGKVRKLTDKNTVDKQDKVIKLLEEILRWTRLQGIQNARAVLEDTLANDILKTAYQLSDGRSSSEVRKACGVTGKTVTNYWRRWFTLGIVQPSPKYKGRFERAFSLEDLGIEIPSIEVGKKAKAKTEVEPEDIITKEGETE